ncbi:MAG: DUF302 domain-containing protein [Halobacteriales archaeon]|nr:DUF302 domain-containing protein [Halobacteriales archaeon]
MYTIDKTSDAPFDEVVDRTVDALGEEGFGVLSDIDVQATLEEKLDVEFGRYRILGACKPPLAHEALEEELRLGALLPCNVVVYETDVGRVGVSAVDPGTLLSVVDNPALDPLAEAITESLERALEAAVAAPSA